MSAAKEAALSVVSAITLVMAVRWTQLSLAPLYNRAFVDDAKPILALLALFTVIGYGLPKRSPRVRNAALWSAVGVALSSLSVRHVGLLTSMYLGGRAGCQAALAALGSLILLPWLVFSPRSFVPSLVGLALLLPPEFGVRVPAALASDSEGMLLIASAVLIIMGLISVSLGTPKPFHMVSIVVAVLMLAIAGQRVVERPLMPFTHNGVTVLSSVQSVSGRVVVEDVQLAEHTMRVLRADHSLVGGRWLENGELGDSVFSAFPLQEIVLLTNRTVENADVLVIGLGAGIGAKHFASRGLFVDVVEYDAAVVKAAQEYFGLEQEHSGPEGGGIRSITIEDGVKYVAQKAERALRGKEQSPDPAGSPQLYDFIVHDVFSAGSLYPALFTVGFWDNARALLKGDGVIVMNVAAHPDSEHLRPLAAALVTVFPYCRAFHDLWSRPIAEDDMINIVFLCSDAPIGLRKPTKADAAGSYLREQVYGEFAKHELDMKRILPPGTDVEEIALRDGNEWRATRGQGVLADRTWPIIHRLMRDNQWIVY